MAQPAYDQRIQILRIITINNTCKHHEEENKDGGDDATDGDEGDGEKNGEGENDLDSVPCHILRV